MKGNRIGRWLATSLGLLMMLGLWQALPAPARAMDASAYFSISYSTVFNHTTLYPGESVTATITGTATCTADLPLTISEAVITGRIVAVNNADGNSIVVNSSYTVDISSFPCKKGQSVSSSCTVQLDFPADAETGQYTITGEIISARVKSVLWFSVTSYLPSSQNFGTLSVVAQPPPQTQPPDTPRITPPGTTYIEGEIDSHGLILENVTATSADGDCSVTLPAGTIALAGDGSPLQEIGLIPGQNLPAAPSGLSMITAPYVCSPAGATFSPSANLSISYDLAQLPASIDQSDLFIAHFDETSGQWQALSDIKVDADAHTVSAGITGFGTYCVMARTAPASFTVSDMAAPAGTIYAGQSIYISAIVSNNGDLPGSCTLNLSINNELKQSRQVSLPGGTEQQVGFTLKLDEAGSFIIALNDAHITLNVKAPAGMASEPVASAPGTSNPASPVNSLPGIPPTASPAPVPEKTTPVPVLRMLPVTLPFFWWWFGVVAFPVMAFCGLALLLWRRRSPKEKTITLDLPD